MLKGIKIDNSKIDSVDNAINEITKAVAVFTNLEDYNIMTACVIEGEVVITTEYTLEFSDMYRLELAIKAVDYRYYINKYSL